MFEDLIGKKYGRLIVLNKEPSQKTRSTMWKCQCECGNIVVVRADSLKRKLTQSCGCLCKEKITKHNMCKTKLYIAWDAMKQRCYNKNNKRYKHYGGRGIKICDEWLDKENGFINFYNWSMQNEYADNLTIDRIDVNGNYEPDNCRWITNKEQQSNKTNNHFITYNNETHTITEWGKIYNINEGTICSRLQNGWNVERALTTPPRKKKEIK